MNLLKPNPYQKGSWVLRKLRSELYDAVFRKAIQKYYTLYSGSIAGTEDLQKVFEDISGKNLNRFFKKWLYTTGQPQIEMNWTYDKKK